MLILTFSQNYMKFSFSLFAFKYLNFFENRKIVTIFQLYIILIFSRNIVNTFPLEDFTNVYHPVLKIINAFIIFITKLFNIKVNFTLTERIAILLNNALSIYILRNLLQNYNTYQNRYHHLHSLTYIFDFEHRHETTITKIGD